MKWRLYLGCLSLVSLLNVYGLADVQRGFSSVMTQGKPPVDIKTVNNVINTLPELIKLLESVQAKNVAEKLAMASEPLSKLSQLLTQLDKITQDFTKASAAAKDLPKYLVCTKATKSQLSGTSPAALECQRLQCTDKTTCLKMGLGQVRTVLSSLLEDLLLGFEVDGKLQEGILLTVLDLIQQPELKAKVLPLIDDLKKIIEFLTELERILSVALVNPQPMVGE